jgi:hypothetical protein
MTTCLTNAGTGKAHLAANNFLSKNGGSMDTTNFIEMKKGYISTYRNLGSILLLIGGLSILRKWE